MRFIRFARAIHRDYPDIFDAMFECSDTAKRKIRLSNRAAIALHITRGEFYDTMGVCENVWNLTITKKSDRMVGEFAVTNRRIRQQLLLEYIKQNTEYVRLELL